MAAQWSTAASLDWWVAPWRLSSPLPPPAVRARSTGRIGCASVPRELAAAAEAEAEQAAPPVVVDDTVEEGVACEACGGAGWLLCDFCEGKNNNVKSEGSRVYRRCPTCKAVRDSSCARDAGCTSASPTRRATSHDGP
ncbi:uncharacterized protein LOC120654033 [Panicum virgatum]|uniref:uncharacterized protein LOC120654033 n=1 Tax=Panicum virgatum TaxID=38727 RepID=UPI0019D651DA|nr:uncharacterized protein LOC120654033 [Panicum virgatum]